MNKKIFFERIGLLITLVGGITLFKGFINFQYLFSAEDPYGIKRIELSDCPDKIVGDFEVFLIKSSDSDKKVFFKNENKEILLGKLNILHSNEDNFVDIRRDLSDLTLKRGSELVLVSQKESNNIKLYYSDNSEKEVKDLKIFTLNDFWRFTYEKILIGISFSTTIMIFFLLLKAPYKDTNPS